MLPSAPCLIVTVDFVCGGGDGAYLSAAECKGAITVKCTAYILNLQLLLLSAAYLCIICSGGDGGVPVSC
jgi:hypothetical protein